MGRRRAPLLAVDEARRRIVAAMTPTPPETISLAHAAGRVLATDIVARVTQPPADVSAMDGYAVRAADAAAAPTRVRQIGTAPAGKAFAGEVRDGETVRIFTGAPLPRGSDTIVIQENAIAEGDRVTIEAPAAAGSHVRPAGLDFRAGDVGVATGTLLTPRHIGLAAAMNVPWLEVRRRPRVALLATGDEIVRPGERIGADQIVSSNALAMAAFLRAHGAEPIDLGIAPDNHRSLAAMVDGIRGADLLVTMGGASVGEHDLVQAALGARGLEVDFWRIAMRPGKPLMFGRIGDVPMVGVPGNPVSSLVCALVFILPAVNALAGLADPTARTVRRVVLGADLPANDEREDYLRATLTTDAEGRAVATPFAKQDSSMLSLLSRADCLAIRPAHAPAARASDGIDIIELATVL